MVTSKTSTAWLMLMTTMQLCAEGRVVSYVGFPTCGGGVQDAACLANLGCPGYANHGYDVINFAFYVAKESKFYDASRVWTNPSLFFTQSFRNEMAGKQWPSDSEFRAAVKRKYNDGGVKLMLSVFGATDNPISAGINAASFGEQLAGMVKMYDFDGVDLDWENTEYFNSGDGVGENWLITLTQTLRNRLGPNYLISHAPMAPYFMGTPNYKYGGYLKVHQAVGHLIDWYNVQFYNQGSTTYDSYDSLFERSNGWSTNTAVNQMIAGTNSFGIKIPSNKIVIGKFVRRGRDGGVGWVTASDLKSWFVRAAWSNGFMLWQYIGDKEANFAYSNAIKSGLAGSNPTNPVITVTGTDKWVTPTGSAVTVRNIGSLNQWWYAGQVSDSSVSAVKIYHSDGSSTSCTNAGWAWTCQPSQPFTLPMRVELALSGRNAVGQIANFNDGTVTTCN